MIRAALDTTKYAVVYPRQSSQDQVENNIYSLERQMLLREQAHRDGFPDDQILVVDDDLGLSGRSIEKRPGFSRALKLINQGLVAAIYVEDLTRLSRDDRTIDQMIIADACERAGTLIYMGRSWYDMRDSGQRQSYKYQAVGASESWKSHLEKLHEAQRRKASQGRAVTQTPRGYRANKEVGKRDPMRDRLMVHEGEAAVIRALAEEFPRAGSLFKLYEKFRPIYWPDGTELSFTAMCKYLKNPIHRGHFVWGEVNIQNAHPAIIPPELAAEIDHAMSLNRQTQRARGEGGHGDLAGIVWCVECGRKLKAYGGRKDPAYRCSERTKEARHINYHRSVSVSFIDPIVLEEFWKRMERGLIESIIQRFRKRREEQSLVFDHSDSHRKALQRRIDGWTKSLGDPDLAEAVRKMIQAQLGEAINELTALQAKSTTDASTLDDTFYLSLRSDPTLLETLPLTWEDQPLRWRRSFLRRFLDAVEMREAAGTYELTFRWVDGQVTHRKVQRFRHAWAPEELQLLEALLVRDDCPPTPYKRNRWIQQQMAKAGYKRSLEAVQKKVRRDAATPVH